MHVRFSLLWIGIGFCLLVAIPPAWGQTTPTASASASQSSSLPTLSFNQATLRVFQTQQQALAQSLRALLAQNPTPQQWQAWQQQNTVAMAAQQQRALALGAASALQPIPYITDVTVPDDASPTLSAFLVAQADLANARAQIHNQSIQQLSASGQTPATTQLGQMGQTEMQQFEAQNATQLQAQQQRAQTLAAEVAQQPIPVPPPLVIPAGISSVTAAYLRLHDQVMRDRVALMNQYRTATPDVQQAAWQQWEQQNAARVQQMQALAQNISPSAPTP